MPAFRPDLTTADNKPVTPDIVREVCADVTRTGNVFVAPPCSLQRGYCACETLGWEISRGRLLDDTLTRRRQQFETWGLFLVECADEPPSEPTLAVRFSADDAAIFVTRSFLRHGHETYDVGESVVEARPVTCWQRELVGTVRLERFGAAGSLRDELVCLLFQAVVGTSRLPLTSIEAPLPAYSLGRLGYLFRPRASPILTTIGDVRQAFDEAPVSEAERVKVLELLLRAVPADQVADVAAAMARRTAAETMMRLRALFNGVSLSPYTDFAAKVFQFVRRLVILGAIDEADRLDFLSHLVRGLGRHLTAYDLVTFHHRGANYPDALLLTELLNELASLAHERPQLFAGNTSVARRRRRAIRQGLMLRLAYAGHPVPDAPTSPGENLRVMPAPFQRVPEEQIYSPAARTRRLFTEKFELDAHLVRAAVSDLNDDAELLELGTALFLDRPFGFGKAPGEPDQTLLASHVLFSRSIANSRLGLLARHPEWLPDRAVLDAWIERSRGLTVHGAPLPREWPPARPGVVSLADAVRVADDWVMMRSTKQTLHDLARQYDLRSLMSRFGLPGTDAWQLLLPGPAPGSVRICDKTMRQRADIAADLSQGYFVRGGIEFPAAGLRVLAVWSESGEAVPIEPESRLPPIF